MMKILSGLISTALFLVTGYLVFLNVSNSITIEMGFLSLKANVGFFILLCSVLSCIATLLLLMSMDSLQKQSRISIKKELENTKLSSELESIKVNQLEAKIKTLEEALRTVVRDK